MIWELFSCICTCIFVQADTFMDWDDIYVMDLSLNCTGRYGSVFTSSMVDQYADQAILLGLVQI